MLSYMLPVEEKSPPPRNLNLNLNLNGNCSDNERQLMTTSSSSSSSMITTATTTTTANTTKLLYSERGGGGNNGIVGGNNGSLNKTTFETEKRILNDLKFDNNIINNNININGNNNIINGSGGGGGGTGGVGGGGGGGILSTSGSDDSKKLKMSKIGNTKNVTLKRVSFGSSKGSMVETLVFETPTPLPEHAEREFGFSINDDGTTSTTTTTTLTTNKLYNNNNTNNINNNINNSCLDDSGIEMQEELERSKVRVKFFQSGKPQQVSSPPESHLGFFDTTDSSTLPIDISNYNYLDSNINTNCVNMTAETTTALPASYDRQMSTESGWDNPFRPGGDLSREADEIVNMIKGGKPITPTGDNSQNFSNGAAQLNHLAENGMAVVDGATKIEVSQVQTSQNGTKSPQKPVTDKKNGDATQPQNATQQQQQQQQQQHPPQTQISNQVIPGPQEARLEVLGDKKKKKCACCVIQ